MARPAGAGMTIAGRGALAGLCGVAVLVAAGCSGGGAGGGKTVSGRSAGPAAPVIEITPVTGARGVRPDRPVRVWALSGRLVKVTVRAGGRDVVGQMNGQSTEWRSRWALAPGAGLHDIWGLTSTTTDAALSLLVLAGWAVLITATAIRAFTRSAVN